MKKQNYLSAFLTLALSLACLIAGYWLGYDERREMAQAIVDSTEREQKNFAAETRDSLQMLIALKQGQNKVVIDILTNKVRLGLKPAPPIGHEVVDHLLGLGKPSESTIKAAIEYQEKYCSDQCLGL